MKTAQLMTVLWRLPAWPVVAAHGPRRATRMRGMRHAQRRSAIQDGQVDV